MIVSSDDLTLAERCFRLPRLVRTLRPPEQIFREAVKNYFLKFIAEPNIDPTRVKLAFLNEAAERGFVYPEDADPYTLAQDGASWLENALRFAGEYYKFKAKIGVFPLKKDCGHVIKTPGYIGEDDCAHLFRVTTDLDDYQIRWPELLLWASGFEQSIHIHRWRLPSIGKRLISPLMTCYRHPLTGYYRLSHLSGEPKFGTRWRRFAHWELSDMDWPEWREGIRRDRCSSLIYRDDEFPGYDGARRRIIQTVAQNLIGRMSHNAPKKFESCPGCAMYTYCHGTKNQRDQFQIRRPKEKVFAVRGGAVSGVLPEGLQAS